LPTILITGANRGIGLQLARLYAEGGWTVIATALKALPGDVTVEPLEVTDHAAGSPLTWAERAHRCSRTRAPAA